MKLATARYFIITFLFSIFIAFGQTPEQLVNIKNPPKRLVQDYAQIFDAKQLNDLENKLVAYDDSTSTQILVLTVKSLDGYPLESFANEIGENWGVGTKGKDNGVVIVLSLEDRKITIRTGYSAQIYLPPTINKSIIDNVIIPYFREGDYAGGINAGVDTIFKAFAGKYKNDKKDGSEADIGTIIFVILFLIFLFFIIGKGRGNNGGNNRGRRRGFLDDVIIMNSGSSIFGSGSGFGGSSSGGGFGGFGGGSFGGGGASGSW